MLLIYPGVIALPDSTPDFLAGLLHAHREKLGTWRKISARDKGLLVLAHLRNSDTYEQLAAGFEVGVAAAALATASLSRWRMELRDLAGGATLLVVPQRVV